MSEGGRVTDGGAEELSGLNDIEDKSAPESGGKNEKEQGCFDN